MSPAMKQTRREAAMAALENLEPHSPFWVELIRQYIRELEARNHR